MREIILTFTFLVTVGVVSIFAGEKLPSSAIPSKILTYIEQHYPKANRIEWEYEEDDKLYEAEFKINDLEYKLQFTSEGILQYSKEDIKQTDIPQAIIQYIQKEYKAYRILGANKLFVNGTYVYDVGIKGKNILGFTRHYNIYFDENDKLK